MTHPEDMNGHDKKSTKYVILLAGGAMSWESHPQSIAVQYTAKKGIILRDFHGRWGDIYSFDDRDLPRMYSNFRLEVEYQAASVMEIQPTYSRETRHIKLLLHYVRYQCEKKCVKMYLED